MRARTCIILSLLVFLTVLASGCSRAAEEASPTYSVYFLSRQVDRVRALVPEERTLPPDMDPVEGLLTLLLEGPSDEDLTSPIPDGVTLRSWTLADGLLTVDFSARYASLSGVSLTLADYSVAETLCQLEEVEAVEITAEGDYLPYRDHQRLTAEDTLALEEDSAKEN